MILDHVSRSSDSIHLLWRNFEAVYVCIERRLIHSPLLLLLQVTSLEMANQITLTGATMSGSTTTTTTTSTTASSGGNGQHHNHNHSHSHSHSHSHNSCCNQHPQEVEMTSFEVVAEQLVQLEVPKIVHNLSTLLRFGRYNQIQPLLEALVEKRSDDMPQVLSHADEGGHSLLHWAAKRTDDVAFLRHLLELVHKYYPNDNTLLNTPSADNVGMHPLHWACTTNSIPHVAMLWKQGADLEARDSSGCTPLLIAAQYGQVEVVAYLLKNGANKQAVDSSKDSALHWAAYKGSIQVCGLLAWYSQSDDAATTSSKNYPLSFTTQDAYGQTPLHLAALRGHTSVVRYILLQLPTRREREILFLKDKNERTPLDLAIHKNRPHVQAALQEFMAAAEDPRGHFLRKTLLNTLQDFFRPKVWKTWLGTSGMDEMEKPNRAPFYFLVANMVLHCFVFFGAFAPVFNPGMGLMWEKSGFLLWNVACMTLTWYYFWKTWKTSPGYLDTKHPKIDYWRRLYEETLEAFADDANASSTPGEASNVSHLQNLPPLCHTCHIAKPPRSKHCRVSRKCVELFDHYCPFVDNTIGLYNYRYFYFFLLFSTLGLVSFAYTLFVYCSRYNHEHGVLPVFTMTIGIEVCFCLLISGGMLFYHTQLSVANLSTNGTSRPSLSSNPCSSLGHSKCLFVEHINVRKYPYLYRTVNGRSLYHNPWFKGWFGNMMDRVNPSDACYMVPTERQPLNKGGNQAHPNDGVAHMV
eukprot:Nitzschia sp. Nitz4//NODE_389_length_21930_cov_67.393920//9069//11776//NITZ4_additional_000049-RA//-1//CDS//3329531871//834//frame0